MLWIPFLNDKITDKKYMDIFVGYLTLALLDCVNKVNFELGWTQQLPNVISYREARNVDREDG